jgi:hypothetical protein
MIGIAHSATCTVNFNVSLEIIPSSSTHDVIHMHTFQISDDLPSLHESTREMEFSWNVVE